MQAVVRAGARLTRESRDVFLVAYIKRGVESLERFRVIGLL
jgi:hypothetical protein